MRAHTHSHTELLGSWFSFPVSPPTNIQKIQLPNSTLEFITDSSGPD